METVRIVAQVIVGLGILNVWIWRFNKATAYRGGSATTMKEEFAVYGLPPWFMWLVGALKVLLALALLAGIWIPEIVRPSAMCMAVLMLGAVAMHIKVRDTIHKTSPALCVLTLSVLIALL